MITDQNKYRVSVHEYYPFGIEKTDATQEFQSSYDPLGGTTGDYAADAMKFTGHERDFRGWLNVDNDDYLDYMHARYYDPNLGRFLSVDPVLDMKKAVARPQMWNRYSYVTNNPVGKIDPDGRAETDLSCVPAEICNQPGAQEAFRNGQTDALKYGLPVALAIVAAPEAALAVAGYAIRNPGMLLILAGMLGPPGSGVTPELPSRTTLTEAKQLVGAWSNGSFKTTARSLAYHFEKHAEEVGAENMLQYLRKAYEFGRNLRGASKSQLTDGAIRYVKNGYYIIKDAEGKILSYGVAR